MRRRRGRPARPCAGDGRQAGPSLLAHARTCPPPLAVALAGKECVAIASDLRFGVQLQTLATDFKKVYKIHDQLFLGLGGLGSDAETL